MDDNDDRGQRNGHPLEYLTRRGAMRAGVLFGASALAGCMGGDENGNGGNGNGNGGNGNGNGGNGNGGNGNGNGGNGNGNGGNGGGGEQRFGEYIDPDEQWGEPVEERVDYRFVAFGDHREPNTEMPWNVYDPTTNMWQYHGRMLCAHFWDYGPSTSEGSLLLGESWEKVDDTTVELTMRDDVSWHDGTQLTMEDHHVQMRLNELTTRIATPPEDRGEDWQWSPTIEDYELVDELTMQYHLRDPLSEEVIEASILPGQMNVKADLYREWADQLEADLEEGHDVAQESLSEFFDWSVPEDERYGNGPFKLTEMTDDRAIFELFEDYPYSDTILFTELEMREFSDNTEAFLNGHLDHHEGLLPFHEQRGEDGPAAVRVGRWGETVYSAVAFNVGKYGTQYSDASQGVHDPVTSDVRIRKAFNYAFNRQQIADAIGMSQWGDSEPIDAPPVRVPPEMLDDGYMSDELEEFEDYGVESDFETAREYLNEAGYEMDDSREPPVFVDEEGNPLEAIVMSSASGATLFTAQVMLDNLVELGVAAVLETKDGTTFSSDRFEGVFDVIPDQTGIGSHLMSYTQDELEWFAEITHSDPTSYEAPNEIGNPESEEESYDMLALNSQWQVSGEDEDHLRLMWNYSQHLAHAEQVVHAGGGGTNANRWYVDDAGYKGLRHSGGNAHAMLIQHPEASINPKKGWDGSHP